jgi:hypothetical protein
MSIINKNQIINSFKLFDEEYQLTFDYIKKYNLETELNQILNLSDNKLYDALLRFSFKYGILSIIRFIYEQINYPFEIHMLTEYVSTSGDSETKTNANATNMVAVGGGDGSDTGSLRFAIEDKYSKTRNECISYILNMKKYSSYISQNKKFYYKFNKSKYKHLFV